ncbi:MAG: substrate-binding domain-containing protein [Clostridia bacterium]|nr:substrate-binding domain-containing protein [Clostridia bacterium]
MNKHGIRKGIGLVLAIIFLISGLMGCGTKIPSASQPELITAGPTQNTTPAAVTPTEVAATTESSVPDKDSVFYFANNLETDRIYRQGTDGSGLTLICDIQASLVQELDDGLFFMDGKKQLCSCPVSGGKAQILYNEYPLQSVFKADGHTLAFVCVKEDDLGYPIHSMLYGYDVPTGKTELLAENLMSGVFVSDAKVVYPLPDPVTGESVYSCYDFARKETRVCENLTGSLQYMQGQYVYGYVQTDEDETWFRYDLDSMQKEEVATGLSSFDTILGSDGEVFLVQNQNAVYRVREKERTLVTDFGSEGIVWIYPVVQKGKTVIYSVAKDWVGEVFGESANTQQWHYYTCLVSEGEAKEITSPGDAGKLFSDCPFPQMDVSTARKPLAKDICDLFFRRYGKEGTEPLNSKSHGAWLNLADKGCDLILVPAPTEEEKAYLRDRNVEIEMKAFGADGLVFICGTGTGVESMTLDQLKDVYRGKITNWKELGGVDHPITVFYRNDQSGSQRQFEKLVWKEETPPDFGSLGFKIMDDMVSIVWQCQNDPYAIGYSIMTYLTDVFGNRGISLMGIDGVVPTMENVTAGSYPLTLHDYVVIRSDEGKESPARRLYDWFGTPQCDDILIRNGLTPVHPKQ